MAEFGHDGAMRESALVMLRQNVLAVEAAQRALRENVTTAREYGATWADVGEQLGITRQSAQERFGRRSVRA